MPSSPKIKKEDVLQAALQIVIERGYSALNIKAVAEKLGCSTAPISWQFGGMDGLREELVPFAEQYVQKKYIDSGETVFAKFEQRGRNTISLALEEPNLFRFLYMGDRNQILSIGFQLIATNDENRLVYQQFADELGTSLDNAVDFITVMILYTQGIGTLIASGIVQDTRDNIFQRIHQTGLTYLKGLGIHEKVLQTLMGGEQWNESNNPG